MLFIESIKYCLLIFTLLICYSLQSSKLKIHIVPHSHDDVGWLKTMDEYFEQPPECVKCILDNVIKSLDNNKSRTFVYSEMAFFEKWYRSQSEEVKNKLKQFIKEGRFEFVNGGWVMNDEACPASQDIIDQLRFGLNFLKKEFDYTPKVAWQLDPFGHSKTNTYILSELGYENLVIVRIDYKEKDLRKSTKEMEFIWKPYFSVDQGKSSIFTHITHGHYDPDLPFYYEKRHIMKWELREIAAKAFTSFLNIAKAYRTNNILVLYGDDFKFTNDMDFLNIEMLMNYMNSDKKYSQVLEVFYSTPSKYFDAVKMDNKEWPELRDYDFFPYSDGKTCYWTGYFTSRPYLKGFIRDIRKYLQYFTNFYINNFVLSNDKSRHHSSKSQELGKKLLNQLNMMRNTLAINQHHDAVSGTGRELVSEDYIGMLENSKADLIDTIKEILLGSANSEKSLEICIPTAADFMCYDRTYTFSSSEKEKHFFFVNFEKNQNNQSTARSTFPISLKFNTDDFEIFDSNGQKINDYDVFCNTNQDRSVICSATIIIDFKPEINYLHFVVKHSPEIIKLPVQRLIQSKYSTFLNVDLSKIHLRVPKIFPDENSYVNVWENQKIKISFSVKNGFKYIVKNSDTSTAEYNFEIKYATYSTNRYSDIRDYDSCRTGAYMMAPSSLYPIYENINLKESFFVDGKTSFQIFLKFPWCKVKLTIYKNEKFDYLIESKTMMFPIEGNNKEFLFVLESKDIDNNNNQYGNLEFFTDTNDALMLQRIKDYRFGWKYQKDEPVADNFYPINSVISIKDNTPNSKSPKKISVWNDRSQAGTSIEKGKIYLTINRISDTDDRRGLADGVYENRNKEADYHYIHLISIGDNFDKKFMNDYVKINTLIIDTNNPEAVLQNFSPKVVDFIVADKGNENCFLIDIYVIDELKFLLQVSNKFSEPFFNNNELKSCSFSLNEKLFNADYSIQQVKLNGYTPVKDKNNTHEMRLRNIKVKNSNYKIDPFEIRTFLIEKVRNK
jgi:hypothetical protein